MAESSPVALLKQLSKNEFGFFAKIANISEFVQPFAHNFAANQTVADVVRAFAMAPAPCGLVRGGESAGMITELELLRCQQKDGQNGPGLAMPLSSIVWHDPIHVSAAAAPADALSLLIDNDVNELLVGDDPAHPSGYVTRNEFLDLLIMFGRVCVNSKDRVRLRLVDMDRGLLADDYFDRGAKTVRDVMSVQVPTLKKTDTVQAAIEAMIEHQVRQLPVVFDQGTFAGLVTDRDILALLPAPDEELFPGPAPRSNGAVEKPGHLRRRTLFAISSKHEILRFSVNAILRPPAPLRVHPEGLLIQAMATMQARGEHALVAVDRKDNRVVGILTLTDILRACRAAMRLANL